MENINIFEYAAKNRLRFEYHGKLLVEDLYCLPLESLDQLYSELCKARSGTQEHSLLKSKATAKDKALEVKIDIVKYIVNEKLEAIEAAKKQAETADKRRKILEALAQREASELASATKEDLLKQLEELESSK